MFARCPGLLSKIFAAAIVISTLSFLALNRHTPDTLTALHRIYDKHDPKLEPVRIQSSHSDLAPQLLNFWKAFEHILVSVRPQCSPIVPTRYYNELKFDAADESRTREILIEIPEVDISHLKISHRKMVDYIPDLVPTIPYRRYTQGVVMTAGGKYVDVLLASLRMLRRTGSKLPVEVFLDICGDYDHKLCENILPQLGAKCLVWSEIWSTTPSLDKLMSYQYKVIALFFSSFEDTIFLDADAFPAHNPDTLLLSEPFTSMGLVTFPDFWSISSSPTFYHIAGILAPALNVRASTESGIILLSKRKHAETLLLATYYNYFGPGVFCPLLSQGAAGEGDKETFLQAAMAVNASFYAVRSPMTVMGRWINGKWHSAGMKQADPT